MLKTTGKLMERYLKTWLAATVQEAEGLSSIQHCSKQGHSTLAAMNEAAGMGLVPQGTFCCYLFCMHSIHLFNSVRQTDMTGVIENYGLLLYLLQMIKTYLRNREY